MAILPARQLHRYSILSTFDNVEFLHLKPFAVFIALMLNSKSVKCSVDISFSK